MEWTGQLARHLGRASDRGSFTDTKADQMVVTFSTLTLIQFGNASLWPGGMYLFFYTVVVMFAMARNAMDIPYSWLVRPRFFVYLGIPVDLYLWPGSLDVLLWIVSALLAWKVLTGFVKIRGRLK
jgi:phosphatidylglycerophosphate synthase